MFASSGYFRGVDCPYFASGLCEREYCHFRHVRKDEATTQPAHLADYAPKAKTYAEELGFSNVNQPPKENEGKQSSLLSMVGDAIKQVQRDIEKAAGPPVHRYMKYDMVRPNVGQAKYNPTPINRETGKVDLPVKPQQIKAPVVKPQPHVTPRIPTYNPTPIHILKKRRAKKNPNLETAKKYDPTAPLSSGSTDASQVCQDYDPDAPIITKYEPNSSRIVLGDAGKNFQAKRKNQADLHPVVQEKRPRTEIIEAKFSDDEDTQEEEMSAEMVDDIVSLGEKRLSSSPVTTKDKSTTSDSKISAKVEPNNDSSENVQPKMEKDSTVENDTTKLDKGETISSKQDDDVPKCSSCNCHKSHVKSEKPDGIEGNANCLEKTDKTSSNCEDVKMNTDHTDIGNQDKSPEIEIKNSGKDSEKENKSKSSHKHGHRSSHHKHKHSDKKDSSDKSENVSSKIKTEENGDHKNSHSKSHKKHSKNHKHSNDKHDRKNDEKQSSSKKDKASSSRHRHSSKDKKMSDKKDRGSSSKHHKKDGKDTKQRSHPNIFDMFSATTPSAKKKTVTHVDLFGNDSDSEQPCKTQRNGSSDSGIKLGKSSPPHIISNSSSDEDDFIEISSVSSQNSVRDALLAAEDFESDDQDTYDECLKVFNEERPQPIPENVPISSHSLEDDDGQPVIAGKKRVARADESKIHRLKREASTRKHNHRPSPAQVMQNRFAELQKRAALASVSTGPGSVVKKRATKLPKPRLSVDAPSTSTTPSRTAISSVTKISIGDKKRVAHVPTQVVKLPRPVFPKGLGTKVPTKVRQQYLNRFIDECLKIYPAEEDAYNRALSEEETVYDRANSKCIYMNLSINAIKRLRDEAGVGKTTVTSPSKNPKAMSHMTILGGAKAANCTYTMNRSGKSKRFPDKLIGPELFKYLSKFTLSSMQLEENGFPRPVENKPGSAIVKSPVKIKRNSHHHPDEHLCVRCGKAFRVNELGEYERRENCSYHWGKCWKKRIAGSLESYWTCCEANAGSAGCSISKYHVHEDNKRECSSGYVKTMPTSPPPDGDWGAYAMDCEMVYTSAGSELARVTVVDSELKPVFDKLVRPLNKVVDFNTRFSGLTRDMLKPIKTTLRDVQAVLLSMFSDNTILLGHSLESDLLSLKLIHSTVVDTSVVFPHRMGAPYKRALRNLVSELLDKIIQNDVGGHDSTEDAASCMELMIYKIKKDFKPR